MKPIDRIQYLGTHLRPLALATAMGAAMLFGTGTEARAELVGHWFSGAESLAEISGHTPAGTHDGVAVGGNAGLLAYSTDLPPGFTTGKSLDLTAGNVAVQVSNSATTDGAGYLPTFDSGVSSQLTVAFWAKGFPGEWAPWISKRGEDNIGWQVRRMANDPIAGFTVRGVKDDDGWGSTVNVNDNPPKWHHFVAVWDQSAGTRTLYVDGVLSHTLTADSGQTMTLAPNTHLGLGGRQASGANFESYFAGLLFDVRLYNNALQQEDVFNLIPQMAPVGLAATPGSQKINLTWTPSLGATEYTIWTKNTVTNAEVTNTVTEPPFLKEGLTNGVPYLFKILGSNGGGSGPYSDEISATPVAGAAKDILTFEFDTFGPATISGTNITKYIPTTADLANLLVYYTVSPFALEDGIYPSFSSRDFTTPQDYTITAENGSTKVYTVTVIPFDPITFNFDDGLQGWTQFWPIPGDLWENGGLGTPEGPTADGAETRFGRSPDFFINSSGDLTFQLAGGQGVLAAPGVGPSAIPQIAVSENGFSGVALRDVATNTYVLSKRRSGNHQSPANGSFTVAELAPYANDGRRYTLDFIDYNKGGWGWTRLDNVSIPGTLAPVILPDPEAKITSFSYQGSGAIVGTDITLPALPFGSSVTALAPTYTLSVGATADKPSGSVQDFTNPVVYTVTSSDSLIVQQYTVSVSVMPDPALALVGRWAAGAETLANTSGHAPGIHDGVAVGPNAGSLAYSSEVPPNFSGKSLDLSAGNVAVMINNTATSDAGYVNTFDDQIRNQISVTFWAKGFPGEWSPWVAKGGENGAGWQVRRVALDPVAGFTVRGLGNPDHRGSSVNVSDNNWHHFAGVWDQITGVRSLYVDGVLSHDVHTLGDVMNMATAQHLVLGGRQNDGTTFSNYFAGKLYDVRIYKQKLFAPQVQAIMAPSAGAFTAWINTNYPALPDKTSGGDPDGDGVSNFLEFAFGLNPNSGSSVNPITALPNKATGVFKYTRLAPGISGLTYTVKVSTNLVDWTTDATATAGQSVFATNGDIQTMTVTLTPTGEQKVFVRMDAQ